MFQIIQFHKKNKMLASFSLESDIDLNNLISRYKWDRIDDATGLLMNSKESSAGKLLRTIGTFVETSAGVSNHVLLQNRK